MASDQPMDVTVSSPATTVELACSCGAFTAAIRDVSPATANRVRCACSGCQTWAHRLERPEILDDHGATERFQVSPANLEILTGEDKLACMQQTPKGAFRWYTTCCNSPIALTLSSAKVPFVGIDALRMSPPQYERRHDLLGPLRAFVNSRLSGQDAKRENADFPALLRMLRHLIPMFFRWWWRGHARQSPFFHPVTRAPIKPVRFLHAEQK